MTRDFSGLICLRLRFELNQSLHSNQVQALFDALNPWRPDWIGCIGLTFKSWGIRYRMEQTKVDFFLDHGARQFMQPALQQDVPQPQAAPDREQLASNTLPS